jgi:Ribosomal protein S21
MTSRELERALRTYGRQFATDVGPELRRRGRYVTPADRRRAKRRKATAKARSRAIRGRVAG